IQVLVLARGWRFESSFRHRFPLNHLPASSAPNRSSPSPTVLSWSYPNIDSEHELPQRLGFIPLHLEDPSRCVRRREMRVTHGRVDILMTRELLHSPRIDALGHPLSDSVMAAAFRIDIWLRSLARLRKRSPCILHGFERRSPAPIIHPPR